MGPCCCPHWQGSSFGSLRKTKLIKSSFKIAVSFQFSSVLIVYYSRIIIHSRRHLKIGDFTNTKLINVGGIFGKIEKFKISDNNVLVNSFVLLLHWHGWFLQLIWQKFDVWHFLILQYFQYFLLSNCQNGSAVK